MSFQTVNCEYKLNYHDNIARAIFSIPFIAFVTISISGKDEQISVVFCVCDTGNRDAEAWLGTETVFTTDVANLKLPFCHFFPLCRKCCIKVFGVLTHGFHKKSDENKWEVCFSAGVTNWHHYLSHNEIGLSEFIISD